MPAVRTRKAPMRSVPYLHQVVVAIQQHSAQLDQAIRLSDVSDTAENNARVYTRPVGLRFSHRFEDIVRTLHRRGLIQADFEKGTFTVTPEGQTKLTDIEREVGVEYIDDEQAELGALFAASKLYIGPLKNLTKAQLEKLNDEQEARIKALQREIAAGFEARDAEIEELQEELRVLHELSLPSPTATTEVIRQTVGSNEAGPSTPIRRTASMLANEGQLPTPISAPRRPEVIRNPPSSSPSPQPSFDMNMDVDDNELVQPEFDEPQLDTPLPMPRGVEELEEMIASLEEQLDQAQEQLALLQAQERMNQATIEENRFTLEQYRTIIEEQRITIERQEEAIAGYKKRIAFYEAIGEQFQIGKTM